MFLSSTCLFMEFGHQYTYPMSGFGMDSEFELYNLGVGIRDSGFGIWHSVFSFGIRNSGYWIRDSGFRIRVIGFGVQVDRVHALHL